MISSSEKNDVIRTFRDMCIKEYGKDFFPLYSEETEDRLGIIDYIGMSDFNFLSFESRDTPAKQISSLVKTPRLLKMTLRKTLQAWKTLHGEIDFNDLLVANVLRYGAPEAFEFILEYFREIRRLDRDGFLRDREQKKKDLKSRWDNFLSDVTWDKSASENLLGFLFPSWKGSEVRDNKAVVQGVRIAEPTDYWQRLNLEDLSNVEVLDQEIFTAIEKWKEDQSGTLFRNNTLPSALIKYQFCLDKLEQFAHVFLDGYDIRRLSQSVFKIILENDAQTANQKKHKAFLVLWRLSLDITIDQKEHERWIEEEIKKALGISLQFANDLYYYWKHHNRSSAECKESYKDLRDNIIQYAKDRFSKKATELIKVLNLNDSYSLYHFSWLFSRKKEGGNKFTSKDWIWITNVMIDAAKLNPKLVVPQIVSFLIQSDPPTGEYKHQVNTELAESLFKDRFSEVMNIISVGEDYTHLEKSEQDRIHFAKNYAKKWIDDNNNPTQD